MGVFEIGRRFATVIGAFSPMIRMAVARAASLHASRLLTCRLLSLFIFFSTVGDIYSDQRLRYVPIRFGHDNTVVFSPQIDRHRVYQLVLVIPFRNDDERQIAKEIIGEATPWCDKEAKCGSATTLQITISSMRRNIFQKTITSKGSNGFSDRAFFRLIAEFPLRPGEYQIAVEIERFDPPLSGIETHLWITSDPRSGDL